MPQYDEINISTLGLYSVHLSTIPLNITDRNWMFF